MRLKFTLAFLVSSLAILHLHAQQPLPELLYYKFNEAGTTVTNLASAPPPGTNTATILGGITQGGTGGVCGSGALIGSGISSTTDYLNTGWTTSLGSGSWTIAFRTANITPSATLFYIFGDGTANSFRCFTNGVAGATNWVLRGGGLTDIYLNGGATVQESYCAFVFDAVTNDVKAYLNGVLVSTVAQTTVNITGTGPLKVMGYNANVGAPAGGLLDEFRLYNRALSNAEIIQISTGSTYADLNVVACSNPYTSPSGNYQWTADGIYLDTIPNAAGCDSVLTIDLTFGSPTASTLNVTECSSYSSPSGAYTWTTSGVYTDTLVNSTGCDSIITINLTINNTSSVLNASACQSFLSPSTLYQWTSSGTYTDTIPNSAGCDSIITVNLTIYQPTTASVSELACASYTAPSGAVYTASGTYNDTIANSNGCDSIITIQLTIGNSSSAFVLTGCSSVTSPSGKVWTSNGTFQDTIANSLGCDSLMSIQVVLQKSSATISAGACNSYTSPSGQVFTASGTYTDTIPNSAGCDSIITIQLSINATASSVTTSACNSYTAPSGQVLTASGTYTDTIPNSAGCDSLITINLTINTVNTSVTQNGSTLTANAAGATYQWLDCNTGAVVGSGQSLTPAASGSYRVVITLNNCTDTSACTTVTVVGLEDVSTDSWLNLFPNPVVNELTLQTPAALTDAVVKIVSADGRVMLEQMLSANNRHLLDTHNLAPGLYTVQVLHQSNLRTTRFVKQ